MMQIIEQSDDEKLKMYMKCTKKELAQMLILANKRLDNYAPVPVYILQGNGDESYFDKCSCNPKNGGSGICGCILGNRVTY